MGAGHVKLPDGKTLLVDPCLKKEGRFACGHDVSELEGADYVFVNHSHEDHVASLGEVYDRFHPIVLANAAISYELAKLYDIPYVRFIPFVTGDEFDFDSFKLQVHGRHNNYVPGQFMVRPSGRTDELCPSGGIKLEYDDPAEYVDAINRRCEQRGIAGRCMFLERGRWYRFYTGVESI